MATYKVLSKLVNAEGTFEPGETVELPYESAPEKVDVDRLVSYGILEEFTPPASEEKPATPAK